ncbi:DUF3179 domain-containing protein [Tabrizicola sp. TH137]|uniref:DUF3179 domain-containing protein n=1 Tax=Tabrizicola sp. TH137 TaxID=2067452 RepID=UPI00352B6F55
MMRRRVFLTSVALLWPLSLAAQELNHVAAAWPYTDFEKVGIDLAEVISGGPPKDGIPALSDPSFIAAADERRLADREPVMSVALPGQAGRAYPIRYLMWHEIVNDSIGGVPVLVTFCPLFNTGMVFDPRVQGRRLSFGVSGLLRHSDMIMYDQETESWWQQALGQGIVGTHTGRELTQLPALMESWDAFRAAHPDGLVMDEPDWSRAYGSNPYVGYDTSRPFLYDGENPPHGIDPLERVVRIGNRAWPLTRLAKAGEIREAGLVLTWTEGQASALDSQSIGRGREVGNIRVTDTAGRDVVHDIPFAFAFHAFHPDGTWMLGN